MKLILLTMLVTLATSFSIARARSIHPCLPTVTKYQPIEMSCKKGGLYFIIEIKTLTSREIEMCRGENFYSHKIATVKISTRSGDVLESKIYGESEFDYNYDINAWFETKDGELTLNDCAVPLNGGFSIGN